MGITDLVRQRVEGRLFDTGGYDFWPVASDPVLAATDVLVLHDVVVFRARGRGGLVSLKKSAVVVVDPV